MRLQRVIAASIASIGVLALTSGSVFAERLSILHVGDQESWLLSAQGNLRDTTAQAISFYGGIDRLAAVIARAEASANAAGRFVLKLNAGDAILPGPRLNASLVNLKTAAPDGGQDFYDAIAMRQIQFHATVFGNHEFDLGPGVAARFAKVSGTTYLSSNLDFSGTPEFSALAASGNVAAAKVVTTAAGNKIGIVGATTPLLPRISQPGPISVVGNSSSNTDQQNLQAMAVLIQAQIDELRMNQNVKTIVLLSHLQNVANERDIVVPALRGVDLVVSGGGHELMVNPDSPPPPNATGPVFTQNPLIANGVAPTFLQHPIFTTDASGRQVPIVTAHFGNRYLGQLDITIDDDTGAITTIDASRMIRVSGRSTDADSVTPDPTLNAAIIQPVSAYIAALNAQIIGTTAVSLNGSNGAACTPAPCTFATGVRNAETGLGNLVADAMRFTGQAEVSIQNGGGVRVSVAGPGNLTVGDTFNVLPFTNIVKRAPAMTAAQLKDLLEHSVATASPLGAINGRFAQISGMRVEYDTTRAARNSAAVAASIGTGDRVRRIVLDDGTVLVENGAVVPDARTFSFATIDFTANGGDGYPFALNGVVFENTVTSVTYQEALANFITTPKAQGGLKRDNVADGASVTANLYGPEVATDTGGRLIDLAIARDTAGAMRLGTAGRDTLIGTSGNDVIQGGAGADLLTGGAGNDVFRYTSLRDAGDVITDFTPYADKLDLAPLICSAGIPASTAVSGGFIRWTDVTGGVAIQIDVDGVTGPAAPRPLVTLRGLTAAQIAPARDFSPIVCAG